jgi:vitellogenic carboxypeptidase-like protein
MKYFVLACVLQLGLALSPYKGISGNKTIFGNGDTNDAIFVTPYLPANFTEAQAMSHMKIDQFEMYSGFFTIDAATDSNTYFVFSKAQSGKKDAPVLLWLQGGPGASSLFGLFTELGPFNIDKDMKIAPREISWNKDYHMLFLDNPLGTGFSFTGELDRMATNQTTVGQDLYSALSQFYELFPDLRANDFFVTGESYAGKYVPSCAFEIHNQNQKVEAAKKINLKGIAIGDGAFDPAGQFYNFGQLLYYMGMADDTERAEYMKYETDWKGKMDSGDHVGAFRVFDEMLNGDFYPYPTYYANQTGMGSNYFNFNQGPDGSSLTKNYFIDWLGTTAGRNLMHVGEVPYYVENQTVETQLLGDWMVGVVDKLTVLLENYRVLVSEQLTVLSTASSCPSLAPPPPHPALLLLQHDPCLVKFTLYYPCSLSGSLYPSFPVGLLRPVRCDPWSSPDGAVSPQHQVEWSGKVPAGKQEDMAHRQGRRRLLPYRWGLHAVGRSWRRSHGSRRPAGQSF